MPDARQRLIKRDAGFHDRIDPIGGGFRMRRGPERLERAIDGRGYLLRRRGERSGKAAGDHREADGAPTCAQPLQRGASVRSHGRIIEPLSSQLSALSEAATLTGSFRAFTEKQHADTPAAGRIPPLEDAI